MRRQICRTAGDWGPKAAGSGRGRDLAGQLKNRIQLSSDALPAYADAVERAFGAEIDYAQIVKEYSSPSREDQRKYSPATLVAVINPQSLATRIPREFAQT